MTTTHAVIIVGLFCPIRMGDNKTRDKDKIQLREDDSRKCYNKTIIDFIYMRKIIIAQTL